MRKLSQQESILTNINNAQAALDEIFHYIDENPTLDLEVNLDGNFSEVVTAINTIKNEIIK